MPRGRPRKVVIEVSQEQKTIQQIIAEVMHDYCSMPGCTTRIHLEEASDAIDALKREGFKIVRTSSS